MIHRDVLQGGTVRLVGDRCTFFYTRLRPGVLLVTISGYDTGDFGIAPLDEIRTEIANYQRIQLFVDARAAVGATSRVSEEWTAWFRANQQGLQRVAILVDSKIVYVTVSIAKVLSHTGDLIQVYSDAHRFEELIAREVPGFTALPRFE